MAIENPNDIELNQVVRFKTLNPHDNVYHTGKVIAICGYELARMSDDIDVYYEEVARVLPTIGDKTTLTYWILAIAENDTVETRRAFAFEMIDKATLEVVEENTYTDIRVYDIDANKLNDVLGAIRALGYVCNKI